MKRILFLLMAAAAVLGCSREIEPEAPAGVPSSDFLVLCADCSPMTRTDISEGKSTWAKGDMITVIYDGETYEYVAGTPIDGGRRTYFTSAAGIADYDGTELVAYYGALDAANGIVGIEAERDIAFETEGQVNTACAPLVGISVGEAAEDGALDLHFENIFSVIELRIDQTGSNVTVPVKSLKIEPAEGSDFTGYLTCSGTVDPESLAVEASFTGNVLTLNLPEGTDARFVQTLKFPVGRFTSSKGLKATLSFEDGSELVKNIYKSGITTYSEADGKYSVKHLAKAMYAFAGGIACAQDLVDFAAAVNEGGNLVEFMDAEGKVVLLDDIDMSGVESWVPIGNAGMTSAYEADGTAFKGHFDGKGHSILNLKMTPDLASTGVDGRTYGLFGFVQDAVIENLTLGAAEGDSGELTFSANGTTDVGVLAGVVRNSTVRNCVNHIPMTVNGNATDNKRTTMAGFAGFVISMASEMTVLDNLVNYGAVTGKPGSNTKNGGTSVQVAGIAGLAHAHASAKGNFITGCTNHGVISSAVARAAGILAAAQQRTTLESCVNYADQTNSSTNYRVGMITCVVSDNCKVRDCKNYGDVVITGGAEGQVGGLICLLTKSSSADKATVEVVGGGNYGDVICDRTDAYRGLLIANMSEFAKVDGLVTAGGLGAYDGGTYAMEEITASNYMSYIGYVAESSASKVTNIIYNAQGAAGIRTADELMEFASLVNAGEDYSKFCQNGVVVLLGDIDMSGKTWIPIGNAKSPVGGTHEAAIEGNAFTGKFNGGGYTVSNLKLVSSSSETGANYGFFGTLGAGAVVENLVFDSSCSLEITSTASVASGVVAGYVCDATVRKVTSHAPMTFKGKAGDDKFMSMAMIGQSYASTSGSVVEDCHNYGDIVAYNTDNTRNGATGYHAAGVVGYTMAPVSSSVVTTVSNCTNHGDMTSGLARTAGIIGAAARGAAVKGCVNHGDQVNDFYQSGNARLGGILCLGGASQVTVEDCINYGDITSKTNAVAGGVVCAHQNGTPSGCENYGVILTDNALRGLLQGYDLSGTPATWTDCVAGGLVGSYNAGRPYYDIYWSSSVKKYCGSDTNKSTFKNITYKIDTFGPDDQEEAAIYNIFFIGNSFTQDAVTHLPGILAAAGITNVKMTHMYYGGRLMSVYNEGWATNDDYWCFECRPGGHTWAPSTGKSLQEVAKSREWDVVTIQEHTGHSDAWTWNDKAKANFQGVIEHIRSSQSGDPKIYYIMSQAYQDMSKLADQKDKDWTQEQMYQTIVKFGQGVMADCDLDGIIPTGTMLQNLRTTSYDSEELNLSRDGYHMDYGLSRYGAACTVFETIFAPVFQLRMDANTYRYDVTGMGHTPVTDENASVALLAARNAIRTPYAVTDMSNY